MAVAEFPSSKRLMVILAEGYFGPLESKTANGAIRYLPQQVVGIIDSSKAGKTAQEILGFGGNIPVFEKLEDALPQEPNTLLIGIAPIGGRLPEKWRNVLRTGIENGLHVVSGLHSFVSDDSELVALAEKHGVEICDLRKIPPEYKVVSHGSWKTRQAKTILTVGTDCNIGKMTVSLELHREMRRRELKSDFVATGQTGILIGGKGIAVDAVISDYIAGSIELAIDRCAIEGAEYIHVEGQGALTHQGYSGVTLGLIHGTMPDAMLLVHQPTRNSDDYGFPLSDLRMFIRLHEELVKIFRPTKVVGVAVNSTGLENEDAVLRTIERVEAETGLLAAEVYRFGAGKLVDALMDYFHGGSTVQDDR